MYMRGSGNETRFVCILFSKVCRYVLSCNSQSMYECDQHFLLVWRLRFVPTLLTLCNCHSLTFEVWPHMLPL